MFCALVSIIILLLILIAGVTVSTIDIDEYNFGLYYALLAIVGLMIACAICVVRPPNCKNPKWYDRCCLRLAEYVAPEADNKRRRQYGAGGNSASNGRNTNQKDQKTLNMLGPAMMMMHHMINGLATNEENSSEDHNLYTILEMSSTTSTDQATCSTSDQSMNVLVHSMRQKIQETIPETIIEEPTDANSYSTMSVDR